MRGWFCGLCSALAVFASMNLAADAGRRLPYDLISARAPYFWRELQLGFAK